MREGFLGSPGFLDIGTADFSFLDFSGKIDMICPGKWEEWAERARICVENQIFMGRI